MKQHDEGEANQDAEREHELHDVRARFQGGAFQFEFSPLARMVAPGASSNEMLSEANWSLRLMRSLADVRVYLLNADSGTRSPLLVTT